MTTETPNKLRSRAWFDNPANPDMTALNLERYLNYGISQEELQNDLACAADAVAIIEACYQSNKMGGWVDVAII